MGLSLGVDIGSISINTVLLDEAQELITERYDYCHGRPFHLLRKIIEEILEHHQQDDIELLALTGTGGALASKLIGGTFVNEIIAQSSAVSRLYPEARTVIEMRGEDSKLIFMDNNGDASSLKDFAMNTLCAAGTGSFLDQQAKRIGVSIEKEFGELALKSKDPPRIAGRCSVFAKSDMIHLQQIATPLHDIVAGLCHAVARNFKSNQARGKDLPPPILFQGGVAANAGMVQAFRAVLDIREDEFIVPEHHASMGALGALYYLFSHPGETRNSFLGVQDLIDYLEVSKGNGTSHEALHLPTTAFCKDIRDLTDTGHKLDVYLGVDVGSLSTNVVLIDVEHNVIARRYLPTASKPIDAIRRGLSEIRDEVGHRVTVRGVGATGSGRYLTGDFIGADTIRNEITAQATAAVDYDREVDTVFEIGGQDSKFISLDRGVVVDFEMNKVCAAGTGSFLEEQAEKLDVNIVEEFGDIALSTETPCKLGDRCTVFIESDLNSHQQKGAAREDLIGGLAYSIVLNYLQKVVGTKRVGERIFFQGGVANNRAVVSAFEKITGKQVTVPPHFDVTGAIGAAILAKESMDGRKTRFKGFDISSIPFSVDKFTCEGCSNQCEIRRVRIEGEKKPLFYGGRCEKYEVGERKGKGKGLPNLFEERTDLLLDGYSQEEEDGRTTIGIPRGLMIFYQQFPFWRTFFENLGFRVLLSDPTDRKTVTQSLEMLSAEACFPVEVMFGHVRNLLDRGADYIFIPFIINSPAEEDNPTVNYNCPWVQSYPFMIRAVLRDKETRKRLLIPDLQFRYSDSLLIQGLAGCFGKRFSLSRYRIARAVKNAFSAQERFENRMTVRGREVLEHLPDDITPVVLIGRPYNTSDPELNLRLAEKLMQLQCLPIPLDYLPLASTTVFDDYPMMYWPNGQKILKAAKIIARDPGLQAVYLSNFRCGPDSFLHHFVRKEMGGKPYLHLEVDEHSADAGMITRCEAFLDGLKGYVKNLDSRPIKTESRRIHMVHRETGNRVLYFPSMSDTVRLLSAAARSCGTESEVLPMQDQRDLDLGRKYTSGRECFPMICTTGSFLKKIMEPGFVPERASFFMPDHNGPCRFGQYRKLQRIIFDNLGYRDVKIISPSNTNAYNDVSGGNGNSFRITAWKGIVTADLLRKLKQEKIPYERDEGATEEVYQYWLGKAILSCENGAKNLYTVMGQAARAFSEIEIRDLPRKPLVAVVGEIFMRDNPFCSGYIVQRLETLGAETIVAPVAEWIDYSTYRYSRDSVWKRDLGGLLKSFITRKIQNVTARKLEREIEEWADMDLLIHLEEILKNSNEFIHMHYDGDPPMALGAASGLAMRGISGVANILPFTCQPGTLIMAVSSMLKEKYGDIPWVDIAYDGQEDTGLETRLQAFMYQTREYAKKAVSNFTLANIAPSG